MQYGARPIHLLIVLEGDIYEASRERTTLATNQARSIGCEICSCSRRE